MLSALAIVAALPACTTTRVGEDRLAQRDPLEGFNRGVWGFNRGADKVVIKPVTTVYRAVVPKPGRDGVRNFFNNVSEPFSLINNVLQGKFDRAARNLGRFLVNTTAGIGGLFDVASRAKIQPAPEDFGQTLGAWGANGGPYLMLPFFGPSTMRDGVGLGVAWVADPYSVCRRECGLPKEVRYGLLAATVVDARNSLIESGADSFLESALDPYAAARSAYLQRRHAQILNQEGGDQAAEDAAAADSVANPMGGSPATGVDEDAGIPAPDATSAADADAGIPPADAAPAPAPQPAAPQTPPAQPQ
ncbi:VacJ family lipoprotein [Sphingomonas montanisoli]|uniref:VacJ family lipoprotein n=1 Tax=Sphingomonas montanisoli TaxID=2606412 RepID=A0A5D9C9S7_9SPHN|nr:VacJ family lipoprotein [Sphingomonas montanisoli]